MSILLAADSVNHPRWATGGEGIWLKELINALIVETTTRQLTIDAAATLGCLDVVEDVAGMGVTWAYP